MRGKIAFGGVLLLMSIASAHGATPIGGLAVAVSTSAEYLVSAGDNRVLYVVDPASMEVSSRIWLGTGIINLQFNRDGSTLVAEDTDGTLHLLKAGTWNVIKKEAKAQQMATAAGVNLLAALTPDHNGHFIRLLSMDDLAEKGRVTFARGEKVQALGLDAEGSRLVVLMESVNDPAEPKGEKPAADLKDLALEEFRLRHDGKTAVLSVFKVSGGEKIWEEKVYYSPSSSGCRLFFDGEHVMVANYSNINARISPDGEVTLFRLDNSFNYGLGFSDDQKILVSGGLSEGTWTAVDGLRKVKFQPDRLGGWPEYFKSFSVAADGTVFAATSAFRIIKIKAGGSFEKSVPIF